MTNMFAEVMFKYMARPGQRPLSLRKFSREVSRGGVIISYGSLDHWRRGVHEPDPYKLALLLMATKPGELANSWAAEMLATMGRSDLVTVSRTIAAESSPAIDANLS